MRDFWQRQSDAWQGEMVGMVIVVGVLLAMFFVPLFGLIIFRP